jgi:hypothetical protein
MLRLLRQPGNAPGFFLANFLADANAGGDSPAGRAGFVGRLTELTANLTRSSKSSPCAKGTDFKSSLTLHLLFMARPAPAP